MSHIVSAIIYAAEIKYEKEHGRFPVGYYKARREQFGPIRQNGFVKRMADIMLSGESQCVE